MCAALGGDWNVAEALGAWLGGGFSQRFGLLDARLERIRGQHNGEIDHTGHDQERNRCVQKIADLDLAAAYMQNDAAEIGLAERGGDQRVENVTHQGCDNGVERGAQNDSDSKVHDVSAQNKISKSFQHCFLQCIVISAVAARPRESPAALHSAHATRRNGTFAVWIAG